MLHDAVTEKGRDASFPNISNVLQVSLQILILQ